MLAITVGSLPCVITTVRALLPFSFGKRAICTAADVHQSPELGCRLCKGLR